MRGPPIVAGRGASLARYNTQFWEYAPCGLRRLVKLEDLREGSRLCGGLGHVILATAVLLLRVPIRSGRGPSSRR